MPNTFYNEGKTLKKTYYFEENRRITVDFKQAVITSMMAGEQELITGEVPFFAMKLRDRKGNSRIISGSETTFVELVGQKAHYVHDEAEVWIELKEENNALLWRVYINNKTEDLLEWAEVMSLGVHGKLRDEEDGIGEIVFPYNEGALVTDMNKRNTNPFPYIEPEYPSLGKYAIFPNMICSQFLAYIAEGQGIYLGMHDEERTTKHIDFRSVDDCIKLQMRTYCDVNYGEDYEMPFDGVLQFFQGEWQDACEIYRKWFYEHLPKDLKKIEESPELPDWYEKSPIVVTYPIRGEYDTDEMKPNCFYPYKNVLPYLNELADTTESKIMTLLMHWEGTAPWAPPYVWPPYGGESEFKDFVEAVHKEDMLIGLYCSGMGWTQQSNLIADYNKEAQFEEEGLAKVVCSDSDGRIESAICREQRFGYDLCPSCETVKDMLKTELQKVTGSGVDYVQVFDQNHGGNSYFCYNSQHGHTPAPGKWQSQETLKIMKNIQHAGVLLGCESAAAEPFLSQLKFSDNRYELNYYIGLPIPMYAYLYHEYVNNFMGNQICMMLSKEEYNYTYRLAYSFIAGDMLTVVMINDGEISYCWGNDCFKDHTDKKQAVALLKNLNGWRSKAGKNYLHLGKMIKPMKIFCGENSFVGEDGRKIVVDEVLTSAYEYKGETLQFAVNYNNKPVTVTFEREVTIYTDNEMRNKVEAVLNFEIPPLSAVAFR